MNILVILRGGFALRIGLSVHKKEAGSCCQQRLAAGPACLLSAWGSGEAVGPHPWDHHIWILLRVKASPA